MSVQSSILPNTLYCCLHNDVDRPNYYNNTDYVLYSQQEKVIRFALLHV